LPFLLKGLDLPYNLHPSHQQGISTEIDKMRERVWAFRWEGLKQVL
jgi:hypothetical protein